MLTKCINHFGANSLFFGRGQLTSISAITKIKEFPKEIHSHSASDTPIQLPSLSLFHSICNFSTRTFSPPHDEFE